MWDSLFGMVIGNYEIKEIPSNLLEESRILMVDTIFIKKLLIFRFYLLQIKIYILLFQILLLFVLFILIFQLLLLLFKQLKKQIFI